MLLAKFAPGTVLLLGARCMLLWLVLSIALEVYSSECNWFPPAGLKTERGARFGVHGRRYHTREAK